MFKTIEDPTAPKGRRIIRVEPEAPPVQEDPRSQFADMTKDEIRDVLDGHGVEYDARLGVEKLRELALTTVFLEG